MMTHHCRIVTSPPQVRDIERSWRARPALTDAAILRQSKPHHPVRLRASAGRHAANRHDPSGARPFRTRNGDAVIGAARRTNRHQRNSVPIGAAISPVGTRATNRMSLPDPPHRSIRHAARAPRTRRLLGSGHLTMSLSGSRETHPAPPSWNREHFIVHDPLQAVVRAHHTRARLGALWIRMRCGCSRAETLLQKARSAGSEAKR